MSQHFESSQAGTGTTENSQTPLDYEGRVEALNPDARQRWELHGDLEGAENLEEDPLETTLVSPAETPHPVVDNEDAEPAEKVSGTWLQDAIRQHPDLVVSVPAMHLMRYVRKDGSAIMNYLAS